MRAEELPEDVIRDTLESLGIEDKITATVPVIKQMKGESEMLAAEIKRLQAKKSALESKAERLKAYVHNCMDALGMKKAGNALHSVTITKPQKIVVIENESLIPEAYQQITVSTDKAGIKKALASGDTVPGAHLQDGNSGLRIK